MTIVGIITLILGEMLLLKLYYNSNSFGCSSEMFFHPKYSIPFQLNVEVDIKTKEQTYAYRIWLIISIQLLQLNRRCFFLAPIGAQEVILCACGLCACGLCASVSDIFEFLAQS